MRHRLAKTACARAIRHTGRGGAQTAARHAACATPRTQAVISARFIREVIRIQPLAKEARRRVGQPPRQLELADAIRPGAAFQFNRSRRRMPVDFPAAIAAHQHGRPARRVEHRLEERARPIDSRVVPEFELLGRARRQRMAGVARDEVPAAHPARLDSDRRAGDLVRPSRQLDKHGQRPARDRRVNFFAARAVGCPVIDQDDVPEPDCAGETAGKSNSRASCAALPARVPRIRARL